METYKNKVEKEKANIRCGAECLLVTSNTSGFAWTPRLTQRMCERSYKRPFVVALELIIC